MCCVSAHEGQKRMSEPLELPCGFWEPNSGLTRKHFLYRRNAEIQELRNIPTVDERVRYIKKRIDNAIGYYQNLKPIFEDDDYKHLKTWKEVMEKLQNRG